MSAGIAERETKMRDRLRVEQGHWLKLWHDCAAFCMPHKAQVVRSSHVAQITAPQWNPQRSNSVAIDSLNVLSGGCRSWITPGGAEGWGGIWEPHPYLAKSKKVKDWLADGTLRSVPVLEAGGFFTGSHELYSDLGVFGTSGMFLDEGKETPLACHTKPPSEFVFMRGWEGEVTRVILTYSRTAQQLVDMFGRENVPPRVAADIEAQKPDELHEVIHAIYGRSDDEMKAKYGDDPAGMRFASCWIHVSERKVMKESGYPEMPMVIPRWLTWSDSSVYGTSPAMQALADIRGLCLNDMLMATLAELQINPRVKTRPGQSGAVDLAPGGVTQETVEGGVSEWATQGRWAEGEAFTGRKEQQVRRTFHADLFEAIAPLIQKREVTNYVAQAVEREAVGRISPAMGRLASDFINPSARRIFMMLYRAGVFDEAPEEAFYTDAGGQRYLLYPRAVQTNRMSQALNSRKAWAFNNAMTRIAPLAAVKPELLDIYDFETIARDLDRGDGMPKEWHLDEDAVEKLREAREQQRQAAMAQQVTADLITKQPKAVAELAGIAA